jgi:EAL domain-containing protein (putative c-di-GMP-specific phosphodiesterase class I)
MALEREELRLFYQPLIDLSRGVIVGVEALIRWQHPERGLLTPAEFISRAEDSGLIVDIGAWVLEEACRQSRLWIGTEPITTWINVSPRQLADGLPDLVSKALAHSGAEPESVAIEVTEGVLLDGATEAIEALREVHDMGIKVGIDDFGKGFSSLTYLRELPVDVVKLDMAFVHGLGVREEDDAIAEAVVNLAKAIELTSVAEGVETPGQLARLRELGCDLAQGYLFASPQPPEVVQQLLSQDLRW